MNGGWNSILPQEQGVGQVFKAAWHKKFAQKNEPAIRPEGADYALKMQLCDFFDTVHTCGQSLGPPPGRLMPFDQDHGRSLARMHECLAQAPDKAGQIQLLGHVPDLSCNLVAALEAGCQVFDNDAFAAGFLVPGGTEELLAALSYAEAKRIASSLIARLPSEQRPCLLEIKQFFRMIDGASDGHKTPLDEELKVLLVQTAILGLVQQRTEGSILALFEWSVRVDGEADEEIWLAIFSPRNVQSGQTLASICHAAALVCELVAKGAGLGEAVESLVEEQIGFSEFVKELERVRQIVRMGGQAEKLPAELAEAFSRIENALGCEALESCLADLERIEADAARLADLPIEKLRARAQTFRLEQDAEVFRPCRHETAEMVGLAREGIRRHFGITPYSTQCLTVLALLYEGGDASRGALAQVHTGEGKSIVVAMLTASLASCGRTVDIISSSDALALRDQGHFESYLRDFSVQSSFISGQDPGVDALDAQVRYGTNFALEFVLLRQGMASQARVRAGVCHAVIVDEVDNLLVDQGARPAVIAMPAPDPYIGLVGPLSRVVTDRFQSKAPPFGSASAIRHAMIQGAESHIAEAVRMVPSESLLSWAHSCHHALANLHENVDYVIRVPQRNRVSGDHGKPEVILVDQGNTGQLQEGSRYQGRLHQFLEYKHGLLVQPENLTVAEISRPAFFRRYGRLFGLTGTAGSLAERDEVRQVYGVRCFDVPPHRASRAGATDITIVQGSRDAYFTKLVEECQARLEQGRPCLLLMASIAETLSFAAFSRERNVPCQVLNEVQIEDADFVVAQAGRAGTLTLATNTAGRGTDIVLSQSSLQAGGLHVIVAFYPENERVQAQAVGRAGRQGQPGTSEIIVHVSADGPRVNPTTLREERDARVEAASVGRQKEAGTSMARYAYVEWFFQRRADIVEALSEASLRKLADEGLFVVRSTSPKGSQLCARLRRVALQASVSSEQLFSAIESERDALLQDVDLAWGRCFELLKVSSMENSGEDSICGVLEKFTDGDMLLDASRAPLAALARRIGLKE